MKYIKTDYKIDYGKRNTEPNNMVYDVGQQVLFKAERCSCQGGGFTQLIGTIVGIINSGSWYQINTESGIKTVKLEWIQGIYG